MARPRSISSSVPPLSSGATEAARLRPAIPRGAIALDTSLVGARTTGIGLYATRLAEGLARGPLGPRLWFLGGQSEALAASIAHSPAQSRSRSLWMLGEVPQLLGRHAPRLFHGLSNFPLPLQRPGSIKLVLTVHDLIPLTHPDSVSLSFRLQFRAWITRSLELCDAVICDSQATRAELGARFPGLKATVVHLGVDHVPPRSQALAATGPEIDRPYVLYLGALDARKNIDVLLRAFEALPSARKVALVLVGQRAFGSHNALAEIERLRRGGLDVRTPGHLPVERLWAMLARAAVLCCPSGAEGFGLPPLEGLALGVPVVASRIAAHEEILGEAALLVTPRDEGELAVALERALDDGEVGRALRERGPPRAAGFTWRRCTEETARVYREVLGER